MLMLFAKAFVFSAAGLAMDSGSIGSAAQVPGVEKPFNLNVEVDGAVHSLTWRRQESRELVASTFLAEHGVVVPAEEDQVSALAAEMCSVDNLCHTKHDRKQAGHSAFAPIRCPSGPREHSASIVAFVGARSGSVRVPNKNIREFAGGRSLLEIGLHELTTAIGQFTATKDSTAAAASHVLFSSDSERYNQIAKQFPGVAVERREQYYASSECTVTDYHGYVGTAMSRVAPHASHVLFFQVTQPFLNSTTIQRFMHEFCAMDMVHDALLSVAPHVGHFIDKHGVPLNFDKHNIQGSQHLDPVFVAGKMTILPVRHALLHKNLLGESPRLFPLDHLAALDIDSLDDFEFAQYKWRTRRISERLDLDSPGLSRAAAASASWRPVTANTPTPFWQSGVTPLVQESFLFPPSILLDNECFTVHWRKGWPKLQEVEGHATMVVDDTARDISLNALPPTAAWAFCHEHKLGADCERKVKTQLFAKRDEILGPAKKIVFQSLCNKAQLTELAIRVVAQLSPKPLTLLAEKCGGKGGCTCAVMGSSGRLLGAGHGARIDSYDLILRSNGHSYLGFEADVGSRTDLRFAPVITGTDALLQENKDAIWVITAIKLYGLLWLEHVLNGLVPPITAGTGDRTGYPTEMPWPREQVAVFSSAFRQHLAANWLGGTIPGDETRKTANRDPSSGMMMTAWSLNTCKTTHLFGFGNAPDKPTFYDQKPSGLTRSEEVWYGSKTVAKLMHEVNTNMTDWHDFGFENALLGYLNRTGQILMWN